MSELNLDDLIRKARSGDSQAQSVLITAYQKRLFKFCFMLAHSREMAEDLTQDAFIKAFQNLDKLKSPGAFQSWLFQIAKNLFLDFKKSSSQNETPTEEPYEGQSQEPAMETTLQVQKVLSQFEPEDRVLLLLIELEGYSYQEAGEIAGLSEDAVRSKLHRLRQNFLKILKAG